MVGPCRLLPGPSGFAFLMAKGFLSLSSAALIAMSSWLRADEETEAQSRRCLALRMGVGSHALVWEGHGEVEGTSDSARQHLQEGQGSPAPAGDGTLSGKLQASLRLTLRRLDAMAGACLLARGWVGRGPGWGCRQ